MDIILGGRYIRFELEMVWMVGFEPTASPVQAEYSNQTELHSDYLVIKTVGPGVLPIVGSDNSLVINQFL